MVCLTAQAAHIRVVNLGTNPETVAIDAPGDGALRDCEIPAGFTVELEADQLSYLAAAMPLDSDKVNQLLIHDLGSQFSKIDDRSLSAVDRGTWAVVALIGAVTALMIPLTIRWV